MYIKLERLSRLCKDDVEKKRKYLLQFLELVPAGIEQARLSIKQGDGKKLWEVVHFLAPQLAFFGILDFALVLEKKSQAPDPILPEELIGPIEESIKKITAAITEVEALVEGLSNNSSQ